LGRRTWKKRTEVKLQTRARGLSGVTRKPLWNATGVVSEEGPKKQSPHRKDYWVCKALGTAHGRYTRRERRRGSNV